MNILLINANPVVSRLLVLCTRDDTISLDEVTTATNIVYDNYDIIFVDEASYGHNVSDLFSKITHAKKVFISYKNDEMMGFDISIKKPFLPSQIIDIIQSTIPANSQILEIDENLQFAEEEPLIKEVLNNDDIPTIFPLTAEEEAPATNVLNEDEIEKIKALLDMDDTSVSTEEILTDEALEIRKIELIKERLIADGLEIVDETEIVEELNISLDGTLEKKPKKDKKNKKSKKKKKKKRKKPKFTEKNMEHIEDAVGMAMSTMTKKQMKKLLQGKKIDISVKLQEHS